MGEELYVREIERRSGLNDSTLRQELRKLVRLDLVQSRRDSNRVYYRAKTENPLYPEIRNLVLKTSGLSGVLKSALTDKRIHVAFVFGSIASGEERAGSDVDLMVIGQLGLRDLSRLLSGIEEKLGREIKKDAQGSKKTIMANYVKSPIKLQAVFKGNTLMARVRRDGLIRFRRKIYSSPSLAAAAACKRPTCNGWTFWRYERASGDWVRLNELRK